MGEWVGGGFKQSNGMKKKKPEHIQTIKQLIKVCTAQLPSKTLKSLPL